MSDARPRYDLREISMAEVRALCEQHHGYGSAGNAAAYCWGVFEGARLVAAYAWQPPPPGAARSVCPEAPQGVLALSAAACGTSARRRHTPRRAPRRRRRGP